MKNLCLKDFSNQGRFINEIGNLYGRLTVVKPIGVNEKHEVVWLTICTCGNLVRASGCDLRAGRVKSCGCSRLRKKLCPVDT